MAIDPRLIDIRPEQRRELLIIQLGYTTLSHAYTRLILNMTVCTPLTRRSVNI